ncbi:MAG: c-type cytochrome [Limimaricola soesokkakensis]|uniref:c-type cytochrome n=1 Tax=Limimaricola soesokkakensis TaxID=1343159 RepID=UPI004059CB8C
MKLVFGSAALLAFGLGFPAAAQQNDDAEPSYAEASFCTPDYAPDEEADAEARHASEFADMDLDEDGMVSQEEYSACRTAADGASAGVDAKAEADGAAVEVASADLEAGEDLYKKVCRACHGPKAQGMASFPKLAGHDADYLAARLHQYRAGEKVGDNSALMMPIAKKLSDAEIANVAAYIATGIE